jgi:oxygen-independent coproporphyrinogen III oxidase
MKSHQTLLPEAALPGPEERWAQLEAAERAITGHGFRAIGLDHYALPGDDLAEAAADGSLRRNFQGYTTDTAPVLLGLGASSIGSLPEGYVQNAAQVPQWRDQVRAGALPTARGVALTGEDRLRRDVIEQLMCHGRVRLSAVAARHGAGVGGLAGAAPGLAALAADGVVEWDGDAIAVRPGMRTFVRNVAALFDAYLRPAETRHAPAV